MAVFLFVHPLDPPRGGTRSPGRVPYRVRGRAVDLRRGTIEPWSGVVFGDGYGPDTPGPNVDPNILSDLLPWHLSFCRIGDRKEKNAVGGIPRLQPPAVLSEAAAVGDLIVFGGVLSTHKVFIDVVLCVSGRPELPQSNGSFALAREFARYLAAAGGDPSISWAAFQTSRVFRWNLKDSMPGEHHETTKVRPHRQIVGRRAPPARVDRESLCASLGNRGGFNFIPLAAKQVSSNKAVRARPDLFTARVDGVGKLVRSAKHRVWRLPSSMATELLEAVALHADVLVLDPIEPESAALT